MVVQRSGGVHRNAHRKQLFACVNMLIKSSPLYKRTSIITFEWFPYSWAGGIDYTENSIEVTSWQIISERLFWSGRQDIMKIVSEYLKTAHVLQMLQLEFGSTTCIELFNDANVHLLQGVICSRVYMLPMINKRNSDQLTCFLYKPLDWICSVEVFPSFLCYSFWMETPALYVVPLNFVFRAHAVLCKYATPVFLSGVSKCFKCISDTAVRHPQRETSSGISDETGYAWINCSINRRLGEKIRIPDYNLWTKFC